MPRYLAVDVGAESGKVWVGELREGRLVADEVHRFPNAPVRLPDGLYWDVLRIFHDIAHGLERAASRYGAVDSIGICTWGVDFGLLDSSGKLISNPSHYRDRRTERGMKAVADRLAREEIYAATGIQFMPINTINQLAAMLGEPQLDLADAMLLMPDLLTYWLSGEKRSERTFASTTQLYDVSGRAWSWPLIDRLGLPRRLFQELVDPGTSLGPLLREFARESGFEQAPPLVAIASHDTASAVVAVPSADEDVAYVSSGTWSLVGVELPNPVLTDEARDANFTNEEGFGATTRFLKNVMGLWILQECRRTWAHQGKEYSYADLVAMAERAPAFARFVDPDDPAFLPPGDMPARIRESCERTGQEPPSQVGEVVRCVLESLALKYRVVLDLTEKLSRRSVGRVHVVGGGARNDVLNQMVADATGRPVAAGPAEATSLGNLLVQAYAGGQLASLQEMRAVARASSEIRHYDASNGRRWNEAAARFSSLLAG